MKQYKHKKHNIWEDEMTPAWARWDNNMWYDPAPLPPAEEARRQRRITKILWEMAHPGRKYHERKNRRGRSKSSHRNHYH